MSNLPMDPLESLFDDARKRFHAIFGETATLGSFATGRVNLIGEHTDYNDGFVMPMAVPLYTVIVGIRSDSDKSHIYTTCASDSEKLVQFSLPIEAVCDSYPKWCNYVFGVLALIKTKIPSFTALIHSSVPLGGGLSSSASLEMATLKFVESLVGKTNFEYDPVKAALLCQEAEHVYAKVPCGIMDQFSCALSKQKHAMLLDCRSLTYEYLPLDDPDLVVLVTNSNVKHDLSTSAYAERRRVCHEAAKLLGEKSLRDAMIEEVDADSGPLTDPVAIKRVRHVVSEIQRTTDAAVALKNHNYVKFGQLMNESHYSLRDDYEVSCKELDDLQTIAISCSGVYGSRMTGGGFGGCTVTLVRRDSVEKLCQEIEAKYSGKATFYVCTAVQGCGLKEIL